MKLASLRGTPRAMRTAPAVFTPSGLRARVVKIVSPHPSIAPVWSRSIAAAIVTGAVSRIRRGGWTDTCRGDGIRACHSVSARTLTLSGSSDRLVPIAAVAASSDREDGTFTASEPMGRSSSPQRPRTEPSASSPQPRPEPTRLRRRRHAELAWIRLAPAEGDPEPAPTFAPDVASCAADATGAQA